MLQKQSSCVTRPLEFDAKKCQRSQKRMKRLRNKLYRLRAKAVQGEPNQTKKKKALLLLKDILPPQTFKFV